MRNLTAGIKSLADERWITVSCAGNTTDAETVISLYRNSCRSQMAEGWTRQLKGDQIEPYSAGIEAPRFEP